MQKQKCSLKLYSDFLIANHNRYSGLELAKVSPIAGMQHDAITRWLSSSSFTPSDLWRQTKELVDISTGYLVCDDSLLDKSYSRKNELAKKQYSGNAHGLVIGISLVNLLWTDGERYIPVDYRVYRKENDDKTKNDHLRDMLTRAQQRRFSPLYVLMDTWYGSIENLKHIRKKNWHFICSVAHNRQVSVTKGAYRSIADLDFTKEQVKHVWLKEFGHVLATRAVDANGDATYLVTSDLSLTDYDAFLRHWQQRWKIEEFHRGIKQTTGIERCSATRAASQKTHIFAAFTAFLKLEGRRIKEHISWYEQKALVPRFATANYLSWANA
ncbi:MAG: transposase [Patescibacteria group bacterium]